MKVVLRKDVPSLGKAGEVKDVADGYGRNYLIPRGLAAPASKTAVQNVEAHQAAEARQRGRLQTEWQGLAERLAQAPVTVHARVGEGGRLYGSVTGADIADALTRQFGHPLDKRDVEVPEPIRHIGNHTARVHVAPRLAVNITVVVEPEA